MEMRVMRAVQPGIVLIRILMALLVTTPANCLAQTEASPDSQRQTAITFEEQGKNAEAEVAWRAFLASQPSNPEAYAHLGFLEARQEHYAKAIPLYRKAMALNPAMPGLQLNLGLALFKAGELKQAIQIFEPLRESEPPSSVEAQRLTTLIGLAYYGLQEYAAAIPYLKEATASDKQNLPFRLVLAHSCLASKQFQCVLDVYHEILTLNAESAEADMLAGEALDEMNDHAGATLQFRAAVKANPKEPNVHFGLGYLLWTQGQYEEAAREFQAELANVPKHVQAMAYLADANIKMNHPDAALPLIEKTIRIDPGMEMAHLDLGILYANAGHQEESLRELKVAAKLSPNDVNVHWRLARLYQAMGRKDEANAEFQKTRNLTKAADDSVSSKLEKARVKSKPAEGAAAAADQ
ncbi:MAG TPA: tetratricopeptide repeat protein [Terriglobales bacterium]|nr:tetratricopeptide repeat protein [Terriglobales bacterium]